MVGKTNLLVGDRRTHEVTHWSKWLKNVPLIREKFYDWPEDFDPFHPNETASVAPLGSGAEKAGYLTHVE